MPVRLQQSPYSRVNKCGSEIDRGRLQLAAEVDRQSSLVRNIKARSHSLPRPDRVLIACKFFYPRLIAMKNRSTSYRVRSASVQRLYSRRNACGTRSYPRAEFLCSTKILSPGHRV